MLTVGSAAGDAPIERKPEAEKTTIARLLFAFTGLYERWKNEYETRRYRDPREHDPDYARRLRELEGQIAEIDREQHGFRMGDYHERQRKGTSWKDWILGLLGLLIVGWLARLDNKMEDISELRAQQKQMERRQDQTDEHLKSTDGHVDRLEGKVYRSAP